MKRDLLIQALSTLPDQYTDEAIQYAPEKKERWGVPSRFRALVACFVVLLLGLAVVIPLLPSNSDFTGQPIDRQYKEYDVFVSNRGVVFPWALRMIHEQYLEMSFLGAEYQTRGKQISAERLGEAIGTCTARGYDMYSETIYTEEFEVRRIQGIEQDLLVAVKMGDNCYVFRNEKLTQPQTLGDFFDAYALQENLTLTTYTCGEAQYRVPDTIATGLLETIAGCREASAIAHDPFAQLSDGGITFSVSSETLGFQNRPFTITPEGYLFTNIAEYGYGYDIGKEVANEIISVAKANANTITEQKNAYLVGTVVETGEGYIKVDDSMLMQDPADGRTYTVVLDELAEQRYVIHGVIRVGSVVQIEHAGGLVGNTTTVEDVVSIHLVQVVLHNTDTTVPEGTVTATTGLLK